VVDAETGHGVPLVELETIHHVTFITDNQGWVAIDEPELMGREVFFHVRSHGYAFPKDGFGFAGTRVRIKPGERTTIAIERKNLAERVARMTGADVLRDSRRLGLIESPNDPGDLLRAEVIGCDSVLTNVYRGRRYWFWGDTSVLKYPIGGSFHMTGASTPLDSAAPQFGSDPLADAKYWVDEQGTARAMATMPGEGPTWITAVTTVKEAKGGERMLCSYVKIRPPLEPYRWGFAEWEDATERFILVQSTDVRPRLFPEPQSHAMRYIEASPSNRASDATPVEWIYFCQPFPWMRVPATAYCDTSQYEGYSCLRTGADWADGPVERDADRKLIWRWRVGTAAPTPEQWQAGIERGVFLPNDPSPWPIDVDSGQTIRVHNGSVAWNAYRKKWIAIFSALHIAPSTHSNDAKPAQSPSVLGEVYVSESEGFEGPWLHAKKVLTHDRYSFYNPNLHSFWDQEGGRFVFFEGTYSHTFSGNEHPTPRYDYNQVLYRLDWDRLGGELAPRQSPR
jgi:hypothetical protein